MTSGRSTTALEAAQRVFDAKRGRAFDRAVHEFVHVIRTVLDGAPGEISGGAIQVLGHLAGRVIDRIEQQLAAGHDRTAVQQDLAQAMKDIRLALEEIDRRHRNRAGR
jgi:hypothetical protein